jgi:hypothetical protein
MAALRARALPQPLHAANEALAFLITSGNSAW